MLLPQPSRRAKLGVNLTNRIGQRNALGQGSAADAVHAVRDAHVELVLNGD